MSKTITSTRAQESTNAIERLYITMRHLFNRGFYKPNGVSGEALKNALLSLRPEICLQNPALGLALSGRLTQPLDLQSQSPQAGRKQNKTLFVGCLPQWQHSWHSGHGSVTMSTRLGRPRGVRRPFQA